MGYDKAVTGTFVLPITLTSASLVGALGMEWSVTVKKSQVGEEPDGYGSHGKWSRVGVSDSRDCWSVLLDDEWKIYDHTRCKTTAWVIDLFRTSHHYERQQRVNAISTTFSAKIPKMKEVAIPLQMTKNCRIRVACGYG